MPITLMGEFGDGSTIKLEFPVIIPDDTEQYQSNIQVTIAVSQQGKEGQPDHWRPPYREATEVKFNTSAIVLKQFVKNLEKLL